MDWHPTRNKGKMRRIILYFTVIFIRLFNNNIIDNIHPLLTRNRYAIDQSRLKS
jgi:hypothetical protein